MSDEGKPKKRVWVWVRDIALMIALVVGVMAYQSRDHVPGGAAVPQFDLAQLDAAGNVSSASLAGKPTAIYFWAPWCGVCDASSHNMSAVRAAVGDDANVLSVVLEYRSLDSARDFVRRNEATYPVLLGNDAVRDAFAVTAFPTLYVLDSDGRVTSSAVGYTTELGIRARLWWAAL